METIATRLTSLTASELALLLVALQYAVVAPAWAVASLVLPGDRRAAGWWAAYAVASALGLLLIVTGMHGEQPMTRAVGNVLVLAGTAALQRGVWAFTGQRTWTGPQAAMLAATVVLAMLAALDAAWVPVRIAVVSALWAALYLWTGSDVWRHVRTSPWRRWAALYAAPLVLASLMLAARALRAAQAPELVVGEVAQSTVLSLGSSLTGLVAALALQMVLVSLLVSRLVGRLDRLSRHDVLTGLLNRRAMDERMLQEQHRVRRMAASAAGQAAGEVALLMVDVDHFKLLNDSQGHAVGDRALQHLAAVMRTQLRDIDALARWGGEEFLALLPATSGDEAAQIAGRLCERVRSLPLINDDQRLLLTVSVGVAEWLGPHDSLAEMLKRADAALYAAKREGRDRVRRSSGGLAVARQVA